MATILNSIRHSKVDLLLTRSEKLGDADSSFEAQQGSQALWREMQDERSKIRAFWRWAHKTGRPVPGARNNFGQLNWQPKLTT